MEKGAFKQSPRCTSSSARKVYINTGAGVASVWLNGEKLYEDKGWTGYHAGKERLPALLHKGNNKLVIEINGDQFFLSVTKELIWERSLANLFSKLKK